MPRLASRLPDHRRYPRHLFGEWEPVAPPQTPQEGRSAAGRPKSNRGKKRLVASRYGTAPGVHGGARGCGDAKQQVRTVREILLKRLDDIGAEKLWPVAARCGVTWDAWLEMYQTWLWCLFPEEVADGEEYTPNPACREGVPPVKSHRGGLFPYPCEGVGDERSVAFARHLLRGQGSPVAGMTTTATDRNGDKVVVPLFDASDLARLGERQERREAVAARPLGASGTPQAGRSPGGRAMAV